MALEGQKAGHTAKAVVAAATKKRFATGGFVPDEPTGFLEEVEKSATDKQSPAATAVDRFITNPQNPNAVTNLVRQLQDAQLSGKQVNFEETALAHAIEVAGLDQTVANEILKLARAAQKRTLDVRTKSIESAQINRGLMLRRRQQLPTSPFSGREQTYAETISDAVKAHRERQRTV